MLSGRELLRGGSGGVEGEDLVQCDEIRQRKEGKLGPHLPKKNQQGSELIYKFLKNHHLGSLMPLECPRDDQVGWAVVGGQDIWVLRWLRSGSTCNCVVFWSSPVPSGASSVEGVRLCFLSLS